MRRLRLTGKHPDYLYHRRTLTRQSLQTKQSNCDAKHCLFTVQRLNIRINKIQKLACFCGSQKVSDAEEINVFSVANHQLRGLKCRYNRKRKKNSVTVANCRIMLVVYWIVDRFIPDMFFVLGEALTSDNYG